MTSDIQYPARDLVIYVAGPLGAEADWDRNVRKAIEVGHAILDAHPRLNPIIPHLHVQSHRVRARGYEEWMAIDFGLLTVAHALFRIDGFSPGADREVRRAYEQGTLVAYETMSGIEQLRCWETNRTRREGGRR